MEAQLLLAQALGVSRTAVVAGLHADPAAAQWQEFERLTAERARRIPLAYLRGTQEFYGLPFAVCPSVLIPRPETELLVDFALEKLWPVVEGRAGEDTSGRDGPLLVDVGTGSGCIAVAALANFENARGVALDVSPEALAVARRNAGANGVAERLRFARGSLLSGISAASVDCIVSNPPYIPTSEISTLQTEVREWEPRLALDGGEDGLVFQRGLAAGAVRTLRPGGWLAVEVAWGQAGQVVDLLRTAGLNQIETRLDLAGVARLVCGQKREQGRQRAWT
jgi:release factor glutamine methyltransferase